MRLYSSNHYGLEVFPENNTHNNKLLQMINVQLQMEVHNCSREIIRRRQKISSRNCKLQINYHCITRCWIIYFCIQNNSLCHIHISRLINIHMAYSICIENMQLFSLLRQPPSIFFSHNKNTGKIRLYINEE